MNRKQLARARFLRTSAEGGGGGGTGGTGGTGSGDQQGGGTGGQGTGTATVEMVKDAQGVELYPANTALAEMKPEHRENYWRNQSKVQQKKYEDEKRVREEAERKLQGGTQGDAGSGTVRDQQQSQPDQQQAVSAAREEGRREGQRQAVLVSLSTSLQMRGKNAEDITELLGVVDPAKFLDDSGTLDGTKVANYLARVAPASGGGTGGNPGQGQQQQAPTNRRAQAMAEAERRGYGKQAENRGALGGLRK